MNQMEGYCPSSSSTARPATLMLERFQPMDIAPTAYPDPLPRRSAAEESKAYSVPNGAVVEFRGGYANAAGDRWLESLTSMISYMPPKR